MKMDVYFEKLSLTSFIVGLIKTNNAVSFLKKKIKSIYFFDCSRLTKKTLIPLVNLLVGKVEQLDFKMMDIKDKNQELVRLRIFRLDLFNIQREIINSKEYKYFYHETWSQDSIVDYLQKGLVEGEITNASSYARILYIINVVYLQDKSKAIFIANDRAWFDILKRYALDFNIQLVNGKVKVFSLQGLKISFAKFPNIYALLLSLKYRSLNIAIKNIFENFLNTSGKIFIDGRGDLNCNNDGYHSDFFMCQNSKLSYTDLVSKVYNKYDYKLLNQAGINPVYETGVFRFGCKRNYKVPKINYLYKYRKEYFLVKSLLYSYDLERFNWSIFFKRNNIKIYNTWYKYSNKHISISDAIKDNGGVSTVIQIAFDGFQNFQNIVCSDVHYVFSELDLILNKRLGSKTKINYNYGYPRDYASKLVSDEAKGIRNYLKSNGAKKIIFSIDENSSDDNRWHTGHELQRENYSYILKEVLNKPWLGVVFKPKCYPTLRERLGPVNNLLVQAELTGRCYIFKESGKYTTNAPPILAGLSADVCIHGHLSAGTAALECAIEGIPTLLIDREGAPFSALNELEREIVVFRSWQSAIATTISYFQDPESVPGFGDWSDFLRKIELVPDGKSANRIGSNLLEILELCNNKFSRKEIFNLLMKEEII